MKDKERAKELEEFNAKTGIEEVKTTEKKGPATDADELEKRRMIMRNVKKEIDREEAE